MKLLFSDDHEYARVENGVATVGISSYAQAQLGDVVYVELPKVGAKLTKGAQAGVVESVKSASDVYTPVGGEVVEINEALAKEPALVNADPLGKGWFFKVKLASEGDLNGLKTEAEYAAWTQGL